MFSESSFKVNKEKNQDLFLLLFVSDSIEENKYMKSFKILWQKSFHLNEKVFKLMCTSLLKKNFVIVGT